MAGAFCIYGISRAYCQAEADKKTPTAAFTNGTMRDLTMAEWIIKRDEMAARLFAEKKRPVKVSPEFDAPQFCADWLAINPGNVRDPVLMVRGIKRDKEGNPVMNDGVPVETWLNYAEECKRQKIKPAIVDLDAITA